MQRALGSPAPDTYKAGNSGGFRLRLLKGTLATQTRRTPGFSAQLRPGALGLCSDRSLHRRGSNMRLSTNVGLMFLPSLVITTKAF